MDIKVSPSRLKGSVRIPSSKSLSHRNIIAAALAQGTSVVRDVTSSKDIEVTCSAMRAFGAQITADNDTYTVNGIGSVASDAVCDCGESGSTLRFIIPIAAALGINTRFEGHGKLPQRPITPYIREFSKKGISFDREAGLPMNMSGRLSSGIFELEGDISSQFVTGLLFALPLLDGNSWIRLLSPLQSRPYADMTIETLRIFGIKVDTVDDGFEIAGGQSYSPADVSTEGDYSQAAFFYTANAFGADIDISGLSSNSAQGDRTITDIIGNARREDGFAGFTQDVSDIPDLVPILAVFGSLCGQTSRLTNAQRLRIKESDRLVSTADMINSMGGNVRIAGDSLEIDHIPLFHGGVVDSYNDHRIVMAAAIAASMYSDSPVIIKDAQAVSKSYPTFFDDLRSLGGVAEIV